MSWKSREARIRVQCAICSAPIKRQSIRYCSYRCQHTAKYRAYIERWLAGVVSGAKVGGVSAHVRRYLIEQGGERCSRCGWAERNPVTGKVPLEVDHINGNYADNSLVNVRLLCPSCHALTPTFRALNKGNGRPWTMVRREAQ